MRAAGSPEKGAAPLDPTSERKEEEGKICYPPSRRGPEPLVRCPSLRDVGSFSFERGNRPVSSRMGGTLALGIGRSP